MRRLDALVAINREGAARAVRSWTQLPDPDAVEVGEDHPYAHDLDLFGHASVMHLLGTVATAPGRETLSRWLGAPAPADVIRDRQDAVAELAPALDFRQALAADGRTAGRISAARIQRFLEWADDVHPGQGTRGITVARIAGPLLGVSAVWLFGTWILGGNAAGVVWIVPVLLNAWLTSIYRHRVEASLGPVSANAGAFQQYADILETMDGREFTATALREIRTAIRHEGQSAHQRLRKLYSLVHLADLRHSSAHGLIQIFTLWDLHVLVGLERWKHQSGRLVRRWMRGLGEMEALSALAGLAHDQPEWVYPTVDENALGTMEGENVGHPLLPDAGRVSNDVAIGPAGTFLLVTGSNMSGKSTLLRAIGLNIVLGQAGGVVCATRFRMPPTRLYTSMRIHDSLEQGVSYFMAGVMRLKTIIESARAHEASSATFVYLLDEILQGTNTAERQVAVRNIIGELLKLETIGAVTTHDLSLADTDRLRKAGQAVHFSEQIATGPDDAQAKISFDYQLRPGIATSTNALRLLQVMGIGAQREE